MRQQQRDARHDLVVDRLAQDRADGAEVLVGEAVCVRVARPERLRRPVGRRGGGSSARAWSTADPRAGPGPRAASRGRPACGRFRDDRRRSWVSLLHRVADPVSQNESSSPTIQRCRNRSVTHSQRSPGGGRGRWPGRAGRWFLKCSERVAGRAPGRRASTRRARRRRRVDGGHGQGQDRQAGVLGDRPAIEHRRQQDHGRVAVVSGQQQGQGGFGRDRVERPARATACGTTRRARRTRAPAPGRSARPPATRRRRRWPRPGSPSRASAPALGRQGIQGGEGFVEES